jgi:hypothetical protein
MNPGSKETLRTQQIKSIFRRNRGSPFAVHFLDLFHKYGQPSILVDACVESWFEKEANDEWLLFVELLSDGLTLRVINRHRRADDISKLKFANLIWTFAEHHVPYRKDPILGFSPRTSRACNSTGSRTVFDDFENIEI